MKFIFAILLLTLCGCVSFHLPHLAPPPATVQSAVAQADQMMWLADLLLWVSVPCLVWRGHPFTAGLTAVAGVLLPVLTVLVSAHLGWDAAGAALLSAGVFFVHYKTVIEPITKTKTQQPLKK